MRDQHCQFPGGCSVPGSQCHVHHIVYKSRGGKTTVNGCILLRGFHHLVLVHRMGWEITLNADGTTEAQGPDGGSSEATARPARVIHPRRLPPTAATRELTALEPGRWAAKCAISVATSRPRPASLAGGRKKEVVAWDPTRIPGAA